MPEFVKKLISFLMTDASLVDIYISRNTIVVQIFGLDVWKELGKEKCKELFAFSICAFHTRPSENNCIYIVIKVHTHELCSLIV